MDPFIKAIGDSRPEMRLKASPSQVKKYRQCKRLIGFEYVEKIRPPSSAKQQFGTDVHAHLEEWLNAGVVPPNTPEGLVAKQGIDAGLLPTPGLLTMQVEDRFLYNWCEDIDMSGFIDCSWYEPGAPSLAVVLDHKSTSSLRWAMTPEQLETDVQALGYAIQGMLRFNTPIVKAKWVYYAASNPKTGPRKPSGTKVVEATFDCRKQSFKDLAGVLTEDLKDILNIRRQGLPGLMLPPSPESCSAYGGCYHRATCNLTPNECLAAYMEKDTPFRG